MELRYLLSAHRFTMLNICFKFRESISKAFKVADVNSTGDSSKVAANDYRQVCERIENRIPISRHA